MDEQAGRLYVDGKVVYLTFLQYRILRHFIHHPHMLFTRSQIIDALWGDKWEVGDATVRQHVRALREKLSPYSDFIETYYGAGYRWEPYD